MLLLEAVEQLQTVKPATLEPNIEENQIGPTGTHGGKRLVAVAGRAGAMTLVLQNACDQLADIRLIVNDQDIGCHAVTVALFASTIPPLRVLRAAAVRKSFRRRAPRRTAIASTPRGRPQSSPTRRAVRVVRRAPQEYDQQWRGRGRSPFPAESRKA